MIRTGGRAASATCAGPGIDEQDPLAGHPDHGAVIAGRQAHSAPVTDGFVEDDDIFLMKVCFSLLHRRSQRSSADPAV